ncbi:MAG: precorrin-6y C5,15-methyltransferase (decarboxylating) subunit CbiE [Pseudomonadota bacterium]
MRPWLTVIGVGLDGLDGLSQRARDALEAAELIAGSSRLLDAICVAPEKRYVWPSPFSEGLAHIVAQRGQSIAVLATGDPMHYGVGASLTERIAVAEMAIIPAPSAFSLAASRLGWALQDVDCISLHGRPLETLFAALQPDARLLILTSDGEAPSQIMSMLLQAGYGPSQITILENLGGPDEARLELRAEEHSFDSFAALNVMAIQCIAEEDVQHLPPLPGLPDGAFLHDGQMTKREVRAMTLAALAPAPGDRLWDVGAGCGSVAIEWLRAAPRSSAVAFERDDERIGMIQHNALRLGVPQLSVVEGPLPDSLTGQAPPNAIFHGGALASQEVFEHCWSALPSGGRIVANAVTLEGEAALSERHTTHGGELVRIEVSRAIAVGRFRGMQPGMAVMQWRAVKP